MKYWWPTIAWAGLIFYLSSRPTIATTDIYWQDFFLKKTAHFVEYFIFAWLLRRSLKNTTALRGWSLFITTLTLTALYAASDEFHQSLVPGRGPALRDVVIDIAGGLASQTVAQKTGLC